MTFIGEKPADLAQTITIAELSKWRFHWILCDLWDIEKSFNDFYNGKYKTKEQLIELVYRVQKLQGVKERIIWEIATMIDEDYTTVVEAAFKETEKYQALNVMFENIRVMVIDRIADLNGKEIAKLSDTMRRSY